MKKKYAPAEGSPSHKKVDTDLKQQPNRKSGKKLDNPKEDVWIPTTCWFCATGGPCLHRYHRIDGVLVNVEGNTEEAGFAELSRNQGRLCPKPFSLIEKVYNPHRIKTPLKRTNPEKGIDKDPGWVEISWDEALDTVAKRLKTIRQKDPRGVCATFVSVAQMSMQGTWEPFYITFGPMQDLRGGSGMRCGLGVHIFGNTIHGGFRCVADLDYTKYMIIMGSNMVASGGICGNLRYSEVKRVVIDPVLNLTAAKADEWLPIKPGTDIAFMLSMMNVIINELGIYDVEFLQKTTNSPYLVGPEGNFVRGDKSGKPLIWDAAGQAARGFDDPGLKDPALTGEFTVNGVKCKPAFQLLKEHVMQYTPEWAESICGIPSETIRRITREFVENARIGSTIRIEGIDLPY
ncbi:MAG: molybdopterin-dependent oxidoreductase, partial [Dehalococcoidia bacterium]|nr:molybdopterin-dependent oxidoreductase [Dehalococcoidia bacterium]